MPNPMTQDFRTHGAVAEKERYNKIYFISPLHSGVDPNVTAFAQTYIDQAKNAPRVVI